MRIQLTLDNNAPKEQLKDAENLAQGLKMAILEECPETKPNLLVIEEEKDYPENEIRWLLYDCLLALNISKETITKIGDLKGARHYARSLVFGEVHRLTVRNLRLERENERLSALVRVETQEPLPF